MGPPPQKTPLSDHLHLKLPGPSYAVPVGADGPGVPSPAGRRGGPMCPPGHTSSRDPFTGRHIGRPLQILLQHPSTSGQRAGTEPRPYSRRMPNAGSRSTGLSFPTSSTRQGPGMTAGTPPRTPVPRPNVPRNARSEAPAPVLLSSPVPFGKVSKGRAKALPLVVSRGLSGGKLQGSHHKPAQRLRWEKEEQRNE